MMLQLKYHPNLAKVAAYMLLLGVVSRLAVNTEGEQPELAFRNGIMPKILKDWFAIFLLGMFDTFTN